MILEELRETTKRRSKKTTFPLEIFDICNRMREEAMKGRYVCKFGECAINENMVEFLESLGFNLIHRIDVKEILVSWRPIGEEDYV